MPKWQRAYNNDDASPFSDWESDDDFGDHDDGDKENDDEANGVGADDENDDEANGAGDDEDGVQY